MYIRVEVTAGARKESFVQDKELYFSAKVKELAQRNMANKRVRELVAAYFKLPLGKVKMVSGHQSVRKLFVVEERDDL